MTKLDAAAIYAGFNILVLFVLSLAVVRARITHKVMLGDGGNPAVLRAVRAHANAAEYIPASIAGLAIFALLDPTPLWSVHAIGAALTVGRIAHGIGLSQTEGRSAGRAIGTLLSWIVILALGVGLVWAGLTPALAR